MNISVEINLKERLCVWEGEHLPKSFCRHLECLLQINIGTILKKKVSE